MAQSDRDLRQQVYDACNMFHAKNIDFTVRQIGYELPQQHSTSTIHKYIKQWKEQQEAECKRVRDSFLSSEVFMKALADQTDKLIKAAVKDERQYKEDHQLLHEQALKQMESLEEELSVLQAENTSLQQQKKTLLNDIEIKKETQQSERKVMEANFKQAQTQRNKKLEIAEEKVQELKKEITRQLASIVELKASIKQMSRQVEMQQKQQDMLTEKNQELNDAKIEYAKQLAVAEARIEELERRIKGNDD